MNLIAGIPVSALINAGSAGAVIFVVIIFLRFIRERDTDWRNFFVSLRSEDIAASEKMLIVMDRLIVRVERLEDKFDKHDTTEMEVLRALTALMAKLAEKQTQQHTSRRRPE